MRSTRRSLFKYAAVLLTLCYPGTSPAQDRVSETVHNLSAGGPGMVRAQTEQQVCIFCHAPHNTSGLRPLWNRELPVTSYRIYESSTLDAQPGQPTGPSKLCLSCHDGTIALGDVLSRADIIRMVGGQYMPAGLTNLSTDLSDDHPISFYYSSGLAASDRQLVNPAGLPREVKLDASGQMQCTSCHDPHKNTYGNFLTMGNEFGALCTTCHAMEGWNACSHQTSGAPTAGARSGDWSYATVAENACSSCHRSHGAGGAERLLISAQEEENCLVCHDATVAGHDIRAQLDKLSAHDPRRYQGLHDPVEVPTGESEHVECADCHNPHAVSAPQETVGNYIPIGNTLLRARGVTSGGTPIDDPNFEYEVCLKCHGDSAVEVSRRIVRLAYTNNLRLDFSPTSFSYHPVMAAVATRGTVSLVPGLTIGTMIRCTDCHNNDTGPGNSGSGPDGPHGSNHEFLLERNYTVRDNTPESDFEYAMCYKCHERDSVLSNMSFSEHSRHIDGQDTPCSACHDPHGISTTSGSLSDHTHLINFDITIVRPEPGTQRLEFRDLGTRAGSCTLVCHGRVHLDTGYSSNN